MTTINVHSSIGDCRGLYDYIINKKLHQQVQQKRKNGSFLYKCFFYFAEEELTEKWKKEIIASYQQDTLVSYEEKKAYIGRSFLMHTYDFGEKIGSLMSIQAETLNTLAQEYIDGTINNDTIFEQKLDTILKNIMHSKKYKKLSYKIGYVSHLSDDIRAFKDNHELVHMIINEGITDHVYKKIQDFYTKYRDIPLCIKYIGRWDILGYNNKYILDKQSYDTLISLKNAKYTVTLHRVDGATPAGSIGSKNFYNTGVAYTIGSFRKHNPRWGKILISILAFSVTAIHGGRSIAIIALAIFIKQFGVSKANQAGDIIATYNAFHENPLLFAKNYKQLHNAFGAKKDIGANTFKKIRYLYTSIYNSLPRSLFEDTQYAQADVYQDTKEAGYKHAHLLYTNIIGASGLGLQSFVIGYPSIDTAEQTLYDTYKYILLWHQKNNTPIPRTNQNTNQQKGIVRGTNAFLQDCITACKNFSHTSAKRGIQDGTMTATITLATGLFSWLYLAKDIVGPVAYASHTTTQILLDTEHPIRDTIQQLGDNPHPSDIQEAIHTLGYSVKGTEIWQDASTGLDTAIQAYIPSYISQDQIDIIIKQLHNGSYTSLRECLVQEFGYEQGNTMTQDIIQHIRRAGDQEGASEVFSQSFTNGLDASFDTQGRTRTEQILNRIYNYKGYESYSQWINKDRIEQSLTAIKNNNFDTNYIQQNFNPQQQAVLTHTAFLYIKSENLYDIFIDTILEQKIGDIDISFTEDIEPSLISDDGNQSIINQTLGCIQENVVCTPVWYSVQRKAAQIAS